MKEHITEIGVPVQPVARRPILSHAALRVFPLLLAATVIVGAIHGIEAFTRGRIVQMRDETYTSSAVPPALDGYVIAFMSDVHNIDFDQLQQVADDVTSRGVDLLAIGGDFAENPDRARRCVEIISSIQTTDGRFGVQGNHDTTGNAILSVYRDNGITPLANEGTLLDRVPLYISGVTDLWHGRSDTAAATADRPSGAFSLMLSHNPDVAIDMDCANVDLMLSGHTHGGQVTLFGLWRPLLRSVTNYPAQFGGGWAHIEGSPDVYVTKGVGQAKTAPRVFAPPEVVFITLRSA